MDRLISEYLATAQDNTTQLSELLAEASCIDMTPEELGIAIKELTGYEAAIDGWIKEGKIPNGMMRRVILTNAETIIRERGLQPQKTLLNIP
jgi:hypothetical protein